MKTKSKTKSYSAEIGIVKTYEKIALRIPDLINKSGLSNSYFSKLLGVSKPTVAYRLKNPLLFTPSDIVKILLHV